jgi:hypothetical protein
MKHLKKGYSLTIKPQTDQAQFSTTGPQLKTELNPSNLTKTLRFSTINQTNQINFQLIRYNKNSKY